jgi:hypothetical protein
MAAEKRVVEEVKRGSSDEGMAITCGRASSNGSTTMVV